MGKFWDYGKVSGFSQGTTWSVNPFGESDHAVIHNMEPGDTLIRHRMYGSVVLGLSQPSGAVLTGNLPQLAPTELKFGVYYNKTVIAGTAPQGLPATPYDAHWLSHDSMHCLQVYHYTDTDGTIKSLCTYGFPNGVVESFAQRGPDTLGGQVFLVWGFANPITEFWTENNSNYQGIFAGNISVDMLFNKP